MGCILCIMKCRFQVLYMGHKRVYNVCVIKNITEFCLKIANGGIY